LQLLEGPRLQALDGPCSGSSGWRAAIASSSSSCFSFISFFTGAAGSFTFTLSSCFTFTIGRQNRSHPHGCCGSSYTSFFTLDAAEAPPRSLMIAPPFRRVG
jgi:hypothetical protein